MASPSQTVFTGWYCAGNPAALDYKPDGADENRGLALRALWWESINRFVAPSQVVVVDSNSPVSPPDREHFGGRLEHIRLLRNPGHAQTTTYHYCGWTASVLVGLEYALANDLDHFLYIEQDALVFGERFLDRIKDLLRRHQFVFGSGLGTAWPLQQSVFAIRKDGFRSFLSRMHQIPATDRELSPELKFGVAAARSRLTRHALDRFVRLASPEWRLKSVRKTVKVFPEYGVLPFGYGRVRPIRFDDDCFYFQQGTAEELAAYARLLGVAAPGRQRPPDLKAVSGA